MTVFQTELSKVIEHINKQTEKKPSNSLLCQLRSKCCSDLEKRKEKNVTRAPTEETPGAGEPATGQSKWWRYEDRPLAGDTEDCPLAGNTKDCPLAGDTVDSCAVV